MKLKAIAVKEPVERMTVSLKKSTVQLLEEYRAHYKAVYGNDVENSTLVEGILRDYIESDKDYQKARSKVKPVEAAAPAATAAQPQAPAPAPAPSVQPGNAPESKSSTPAAPGASSTSSNSTPTPSTPGYGSSGGFGSSRT